MAHGLQCAFAMNRVVVSLLVACPLTLCLAAGCSSSPSEGEPVVTDPSKLPAPATGQGFQLKTPLTQVDPGNEVQDCYFFKVGDLAQANGMAAGEPVNLHRVKIVQRAGSHHMNIFRVRTIAGLDPTKGPLVHGVNGQGECFKSPNWADWPLVANTQTAGQLDWTFPDGVANVLGADEWLMLQTHYVNASSQKTPEGGEVAANFYAIPKAEVKAELGTLFTSNQSIRVCKSNPTPTFKTGYPLKNAQPVHIIGANGHFHGRGKTFDMWQWDGTSIETPPESAHFYGSTTWDEPPMLTSPKLDVMLPPNSGVMYGCSYQWVPPSEEAGGCAALDKYDTEKHPTETPDCCYTFGPIVERNEHCNAFVYYWPK